jgi:hypothetical protein
LILAVLACTRVSAQTVTVNAVADALHVQARGFGFIEGAVLTRLKEGRTVRVDFDLAVLTKPEGPTVRQAMQGFTVSFDLWEERFAVSRLGTPAKSVSHLSARDAERWCLDNVTMSVASLGLGRDASFWIRLSYRVEEPMPATTEDSADRFTLRGLIDRLSRRREEAVLAKSVDGGPFRLP